MVMAPIDRCYVPGPKFPVPTPTKPKHDFGKMDTDKSGGISRDEFIQNGNQGPVGFAIQRLRSQEFDKLDRNKDGQLDKKEQFFANIRLVGQLPNWPPKPIFERPDALEDQIRSVPSWVEKVKNKLFG